MKYCTLLLFLLILLNASSKDSNQLQKPVKPAPFKVVIESDVTNGGTHYKYILTQNHYMFIYLKDKLLNRDTIMSESTNLVFNETLTEISNYNLAELKPAKLKIKYAEKFTVIKGGITKTVYIDYDHPQDLVCKVTDYIDRYLETGKYKLNLCSKSK